MQIINPLQRPGEEGRDGGAAWGGRGEKVSRTHQGEKEKRGVRGSMQSVEDPPKEEVDVVGKSL